MTRPVAFSRRLFTLVAALALMAAFATSATAGAGLVYALRELNGPNQIYGFSLDAGTGTLTPLPGFPMASGGVGRLDGPDTSEALVYDAANARLYALNRGSRTVTAFGVNRATGALTALPFSPIVVPASPFSGGIVMCLTVHASGSPLIVADAGVNIAQSFAITATTATQTPGSPVSTGVGALSCEMSRDGNYFYTGGYAGSAIAGFSVAQPSGVLTPLAGSPFNAGGFSDDSKVAIETDSSGRIFTARSNVNVHNPPSSTLRVFTTSGGVPTAVAGNPFSSGGQSRATHGLLHPGGFYLVTYGNVGVYQISGSGAATTLSAVSGSPFGAGGGGTGLALTPDGELLIVASRAGRNLTVFQVNGSSGALTNLGTQPPNTLGSSGRIIGLALAPTYTLTAAKTGAGSGTVAADVGSLSCGATCTASYVANTVVTLTATPAFGSGFAGWSGGGCSGTGTCTVTMDADTTVSATFDVLPTYALTAAKTGAGSGTVAANLGSLSCGATCTASYVANTIVTLTATPAAGSGFAGWSGAGCSGTGTCSVTLVADTTVTATFNLLPPTVSPSTLLFGATKDAAAGDLVTVTPPQGVTIGFAGGAWSVSSDQPWLQITPLSGSGNGSVTISIVNPGNVLGASTTVMATLTVTAASPLPATTVPVTLVVQLTGAGSAPPFGFFDTPMDGSTVTGAIGATGWALDDVGVSSIRIYRNCLAGIDNPANCQILDGHDVVFIGNGALLAGARPDVEAAFPTYPLAYKAGWGMQVLTNMLPHIPTGVAAGGGQGTMQLFAYATDLEGHRVFLGQKTITANNDNGNRPFGTIDTPSLGGTVSGTVVNFGWALTPGSALIPINGSTMRVMIDGVAVGTVAYNQCRAGSTNQPPPGTCHDDIATLFPTRRNITEASGAIGAFSINTTTMSNGLHTLAWGVVDDQNRNDGIGSRFFTVLNGTSGPVSAATMTALAEAPARVLGQAAAIAWRPTSPEAVWGRTGFNEDPPWEVLTSDSAGSRHVRLAEFGRLELRLGAAVTSGYLHANGTLRPLPPGSRLDATTGTFTWAPGLGYIGPYDLVFLLDGLDGATQVPVEVTVHPQTAARIGAMRAALDLPAAEATVTGAFRVAGWALDLDAWQGSGVGAVHVWAQRRDVPAAAPVFLGTAAVGGLRPDVGAIFGAPFDRAGWDLTAAGLVPGAYDVTAYFWSTRTGRFEDARTILVSVR